MCTYPIVTKILKYISCFTEKIQVKQELRERDFNYAKKVKKSVVNKYITVQLKTSPIEETMERMVHIKKPKGVKK